MASKNPVRGFIRCHLPGCECVATVHAVGEHKALTEGQPTRNKRNMGRLYYQCPEHGFQQGKGEAFQEHIKANMAESREALPAAASKPERKPDNKPLPKPAGDNPPEPVNTRLQAVKPYAVAIVAFIAFALMVNYGKRKPESGK